MEKMINSFKTEYNKFVLIYIGVVIGMFGQSIGLPLFIASFDDSTGGYFVLCWLGFLFNLIFWVLALIKGQLGIITQEMVKYTQKRHILFITLGVLNAFNGILIVYSSPLKRTHGSMQAILSSATMPFTVLFSKLILRKSYHKQQLIGVFLTVMGMSVSLIPILCNFSLENTEILWPAIFVVGQIPLVVMNIIEEKIFEEQPNYDSVLLIAWESLYQFITLLLLYWVDIIPGFGMSNSLLDWDQKFKNGIACFLTPWNMQIDKCSYCALTGGIFIIAYCCYYILSAELIRYASANTVAVVSSISPVLVVFFWIAFPSINDWADGKTYSSLNIICELIALPVIIMGIIVFRRVEKKIMDDAVVNYIDATNTLTDTAAYDSTTT
jgi:drug/metabolite transporter (DMT)-like permease